MKGVIILNNIEESIKTFPILLLTKNVAILEKICADEWRSKSPVNLKNDIDIVIVKSLNDAAILEHYFKKHDINCKIFVNEILKIKPHNLKHSF